MKDVGHERGKESLEEAYKGGTKTVRGWVNEEACFVTLSQ